MITEVGKDWLEVLLAQFHVACSRAALSMILAPEKRFINVVFKKVLQAEG
jgi:hypothetical protein